MSNDLRKKYARFLKDGETEKATEIAQEMNGSTQVEKVSSEKESESDVKRFTDLKGVGEELAEEMVEEFGSYSSFVDEAGVERLSDISGIGESRAESLLEQVDE